MTRLPAVDERNEGEAAAVFAEIEATRGFVSNALRSLGHAPGGLKHFARVGAYVKYETDLSERLRELAILCAARDVPYEWAHHRPLAIQAGVPVQAVDDIGAGREPAALPPAERAIARLIAEVLGRSACSDETFAEIRRHWSPRQITDLLLTATYYRALGIMATALGVQIESPDVLQTEQAWQKGR